MQSKHLFYSFKGGKQQQAEIKLFAHESMQQALQQVQQICNDTQKKKFSDLFSLLDSNEEPDDSSNRRPSGRGSKRTAKRPAASNQRGRQANKEESEEESSEEEVIIKQRTAKKRRKATLVGSDTEWCEMDLMLMYAKRRDGSLSFQPAGFILWLYSRGKGPFSNKLLHSFFVFRKRK